VSVLAPHEPRTTGKGYLIQPTRKGQQVSLCFGFDNRRCNCICSNNNRTSLSVNLHQELKGAEVHFAQRIWLAQTKNYSTRIVIYTVNCTLLFSWPPQRATYSCWCRSYLNNSKEGVKMNPQIVWNWKSKTGSDSSYGSTKSLHESAPKIACNLGYTNKAWSQLCTQLGYLK
jgi:hypothetical protein